MPVLREAELSALLRTVEAGKSFDDRRDAAILRTFVSTGARVAEVAGQSASRAHHREDLVAGRTQAQNRLRWHLHEFEPGVEPPARALDRGARADGPRAPSGGAGGRGRAHSPASWSPRSPR